MGNIINILNLILQIVLTFIATFSIYMAFAFLDNDFGFDGLLGFVIFQPIMAVILSSSTILVCFIIGLPIRLNNKLNFWWKKHFYISIIGIICGLTFLLLAFFSDFRETVNYTFNGELNIKQVPNTLFSVLGWFLIIFFFLHTYLPQYPAKKH